MTALLQDHDAVLTWLAQRAMATEGAERRFIQREFVQCLGTHLLAVQSVIKPVVMQCGAADALSDWLRLTEEIQAKLAVALTIQEEQERFEESLSEIYAYLAHLREREGDRLAQQLADRLSDGELELLGGDLRLLLAHRVKQA